MAKYGILNCAQYIRGTPALHKNGYTIRPLASFSLTARTLLATTYRWDRESKIAPIDLTFSWGELSDSRILDQLTISRGNRSYRWRTQKLPLPSDVINSHIANMHLIPANDSVEKTLSNVIAGNIVDLKGYLVQATHPDGWSWTSSLSRDDSGHGACELVWVQSASIRGIEEKQKLR